MTPEQEKEAFEKIWDDLMDEHQIKPEALPKGFGLGGQPGAGKSSPACGGVCAHASTGSSARSRAKAACRKGSW